MIRYKCSLLALTSVLCFITVIQQLVVFIYDGTLLQAATISHIFYELKRDQTRHVAFISVKPVISFCIQSENCPSPLIVITAALLQATNLVLFTVAPALNCGQSLDKYQEPGTVFVQSCFWEKQRGFLCMLWMAILIIFPRDEVTFLMAQSWREESLLLTVCTQTNMLARSIHSA